MFDDVGYNGKDDGDDDERFYQLLDAADTILTGQGEETIGMGESDAIGDRCHDKWLTPEQVVEHIRAQRKA